MAAGSISVTERGLQPLRPSPPSSPPVRGAASTSSNIVIEWEPSESLESIPESPFFYVAEYSLDRGSGNIVTGSMTVRLLNLCVHNLLIVVVVVVSLLQTRGTSITLTGQQASTVVTATITTYSLWAKSAPSLPGTFISLPNSELN